jgi:hypothetical protein
VDVAATVGVSCGVGDGVTLEVAAIVACGVGVAVGALSGVKTLLHPARRIRAAHRTTLESIWGLISPLSLFLGQNAAGALVGKSVAPLPGDDGSVEGSRCDRDLRRRRCILLWFG